MAIPQFWRQDRDRDDTILVLYFRYQFRYCPVSIFFDTDTNTFAVFYFKDAPRRPLPAFQVSCQSGKAFLSYKTRIKLDQRGNSAPLVKKHETDVHLWTAITPVPVSLQCWDLGRTTILLSPKCTQTFVLIASSVQEMAIKGSRPIHAISSQVQLKTSIL